MKVTNIYCAIMYKMVLNGTELIPIHPPGFSLKATFYRKSGKPQTNIGALLCAPTSPFFPIIAFITPFNSLFNFLNSLVKGVNSVRARNPCLLTESPALSTVLEHSRWSINIWMVSMKTLP